MGRPHFRLEVAGQLVLVQVVVAADQRDHRFVAGHVHQRLDELPRLQIQELRHFGDGPPIGSRDLVRSGAAGDRRLRLGRHRARQFHIRRVSTLCTYRYPVLSGGGGRHVLVRLGPAHEAAVALHAQELHPAAAEDPVVRPDVLGVTLLQPFLVHVERVGVLHQELAHPQHPALGPGLVAELELDLVPDLREVAVRTQLSSGQPGEDLLVGHGQHHLAAAPIVQAEHLVADGVVAAGGLPDIRRMQRGHGQLIGPYGVHLLPDDAQDALHHPPAQRQHDVDAGSELADEAAPHHQLMADGLGIGRVFLERGHEQLCGPHRVLLERSRLRNGAAHGDSPGRWTG